MADKKLNEVTANATVDYVIGTLEDGSTVRISKSDLADVIGSILGLKKCKLYGEVTLNGSDSVEVGSFNGLLFVKQRGARDFFVPYIVVGSFVEQLAGDVLDYGYNIVKEGDVIKIVGNGNKSILYLTYRAFEYIL